MKQVLTKDGSVTFYNEQYTETYHSMSGGVEEALKKFAEPCQIAELAKKGEVNILDVCFGLGYNTAAALDVIFDVNPKCKVNIVGLENDPEILNRILEINPKIKNYSIMKELIKNNEKIINQNKINIKLLIGDARDTIKDLPQTFDTVFFDPFSPKKCPELWTEEFLRDVKAVMKKGAILTTYSYARPVRETLAKLGFTVKDGPVIGRRSPSTIAIND